MKAEPFKRKSSNPLNNKSKIPFISIYLSNGSIAFSEKLAKEIGLEDRSGVKFVRIKDSEHGVEFYAVAKSNSGKDVFTVIRNKRNPLKTASKEFCKFLLKYYDIPEENWSNSCRLFVDTNTVYVSTVEDEDLPKEEWEKVDAYRIYSYEQISKGFKSKEIED